MKQETAASGSGPSIDRRDFIGGIASVALASQIAATAPTAATAATTATASDAGRSEPSPPPQPGEAAVYPPAATGLRGQYPGSFELAHDARDGKFSGPLSADDTGERYDLVIVGGGISGLSAAYFFQQELGAGRKILILDNHDDFGGHAKRNEFHHNGRMYLAYGGTPNTKTPSCTRGWNVVPSSTASISALTGW